MAAFYRMCLPLLVCLICVTPAWAADKPTVKPKVRVEFRRAESKPGEGLTEATVVGTDEKVYLHKSAEATNKDIAEARADLDARGAPAVRVTFTETGAKKMAKLTEEHKDKPLAILVDGKVVSAPVIRAKISKEAQLVGDFTTEEVEKLVRSLNGK